MHDPDTNPPQPSDAAEAHEQLPAALVARLRDQNASASPPIAARMKKLDAAIFAAAREHFASKVISHPTPASVLATIGQRRSYRIAAGLLALAAGIALAAILPGVFNGDRANEPGNQSQTRTGSTPGTIPPAAFAEADINRDGQVNLLDAYLLQRRIEVQAKLESAWDLTHDGRVDQHDVQAIAVESVKLPASSPTGGASSLAPAERGRS